MARRNRTDAELEKLRLGNERFTTKYRFRTNTVIALAIVACVALCIPIAHVFAGKTTSVSVSLALTVSITLALTTAGGFTIAGWQHSRYRKAEARVTDLTARLVIAQEDIKSKGERLAALESDLQAVREDLRRAREYGLEERN